MTLHKLDRLVKWEEFYEVLGDLRNSFGSRIIATALDFQVLKTVCISLHVEEDIVNWRESKMWYIKESEEAGL